MRGLSLSMMMDVSRFLPPSGSLSGRGLRAFGSGAPARNLPNNRPTPPPPYRLAAPPTPAPPRARFCLFFGVLVSGTLPPPPPPPPPPPGGGTPLAPLGQR